MGFFDFSYNQQSSLNEARTLIHLLVSIWDCNTVLHCFSCFSANSNVPTYLIKAAFFFLKEKW